MQVSSQVEQLLGPPDGLAPFRPAIQAVRWGTLGVSVALAYPGAVDDPNILTRLDMIADAGVVTASRP